MPSSSSSPPRITRERNVVLNGVRTALRGLADTLDGVPAPGLQGAIKGVLFILDNVDRATQNLSDFKELAETLASYESLFENYKTQVLPTALKEAITTLTKKIDESCKVIEQIVDHCRARRIWESTEDAQLFVQQLRVINNALSQFQVATLSYTAVTVDESLEINQRLLIDRLPIERRAYFNSSERDTEPCMENTRVEIRKRISDWLFDEDGPPIFWLRGMAGTGKSTIAQSIAEYCHGAGHLAGHFFFSRDILAPHSGARFFSTLASQLCDFDIRLVPHLTNILQSNPVLARARIKDQFSSLVAQPLLTLEKDTSALLFPMVIVVDALDECDDSEDASNILSLLFNSPLHGRNRPLLKFLITARPELPIREAFNRVPEPKEKVFMQINLDEEDAQGDIVLYLKNGLEEVYNSRPECFKSREQPWPEPHALDSLVERSKGLFIHASTILKFVGDRRQHPVRRLRTLLSTSTDNEAEIYSGLDHLYRQTLTQDPNLERVRAVVGTIVLAPEPISVKKLEALLELEEGEAHVTLQWLRSLLIVPPNDDEPIRLVHPSLHAFMTTKTRSGDLYVDPEEHRKRLARACAKANGSHRSSS